MIVTENEFGLTPDTNIGALVKKYPYLKDYLISLSPKFQKLNNPTLFKTMGSVATLSMISDRGNFKVEDFIDKLTNKIIEESK